MLDLRSTSVSFRFSAAVAEFGMILRNSEFKENANIQDVLTLAQASRGKDTEGYRGEFIKLVNTADALIKATAATE